jgi:hypothetical protein
LASRTRTRTRRPASANRSPQMVLVSGATGAVLCWACLVSAHLYLYIEPATRTRAANGRWPSEHSMTWIIQHPGLRSRGEGLGSGLGRRRLALWCPVASRECQQRMHPPPARHADLAALASAPRGSSIFRLPCPGSFLPLPSFPFRPSPSALPLPPFPFRPSPSALPLPPFPFRLPPACRCRCNSRCWPLRRRHRGGRIRPIAIAALHALRW